MIEQDENGIYVAEVVGLPSCYTQAKSIPELIQRLIEVSGGSIELLQDIQDQKTHKRKFNLSMKLQYA